MPDDYVKRSDVHKAFQPKYAPAINKTFAVMIDSVPAADVVERPRWIPVTERFPKWSETVYEGEPCIDGELVLVFAPKGEADKAWNNMAVGSWLGDRWEVLDDAFTLNAITHWMPLPEPPKEEE